MSQNTVHAALSIGDNRHITIAYNDTCTLGKLAELTVYLQSLKIYSGRVIHPTELIELSNHLDSNDPLWGIKLEILDEQNVFTDKLLMERIADFSDKWSWRQKALADKGLEQFRFTMHTTIGPKSQYSREQAIIIMDNLVMKLKIEGIYYKVHETGQKVFFFHSND